MSIRCSDLSRWPLPPSSSPQEKVRMCLPLKKTWPVMAVHNVWLMACTERYGFDDVDEVLRHLIYTANSESKPIKKLIFKTVRCLHCHVGARADQHKKIDLGTTNEEKVPSNGINTDSRNVNKTIAIHTFHYQWLTRVTDSCNIASVEKCVRIIIDYYQSRVKQELHSDGPKAAAAKELSLFGKNRHDDQRFAAVLRHLNEESSSSSSSKETRLPSAGEAPSKTVVVDTDDPAACSKKEMDQAIKRCQVGRNSASYAVAMEETPEETRARRAKEILVEESEETKRAREQIRLALGSPMG
mmetsp:Transcript_20619/g.48634  ORF Transcript_20619/g.48634 Transcript_20619/m.48634 type:complete len:299 (+) Transcript_20619:151-1047(+)